MNKCLKNLFNQYYKCTLIFHCKGVRKKQTSGLRFTKQFGCQTSPKLRSKVINFG